MQVPLRQLLRVDALELRALALVEIAFKLPTEQRLGPNVLVHFIVPLPLLHLLLDDRAEIIDGKTLS